MYSSTFIACRARIAILSRTGPGARFIVPIQFRMCTLQHCMAHVRTLHTSGVTRCMYAYGRRGGVCRISAWPMCADHYLAVGHQNSSSVGAVGVVGRVCTIEKHLQCLGIRTPHKVTFEHAHIALVARSGGGAAPSSCSLSTFVQLTCIASIFSMLTRPTQPHPALHGEGKGLVLITKRKGKVWSFIMMSVEMAIS
jgi:hypothetical protein